MPRTQRESNYLASCDRLLRRSTDRWSSNLARTFHESHAAAVNMAVNPGQLISMLPENDLWSIMQQGRVGLTEVSESGLATEPMFA